MQYLFYGLLLITSMLWAGNFVAGKYMVNHASALTLTELRWAIAVICLIPIVWIRERRLIPPRQAVFHLFCMGLTGGVLFNAFMFLALERTSSSNAGLLSALNPVAIAIASSFIFREKMSCRRWIGMIVSLLGVLVVITEGRWERIVQFRFNTGDLFMLAAVVSWGIYSVAGKKAMQYTSAFMSTLWAGIFSIIVLFPFSISTFSIDQPDREFWIAVLYVSIGSTVLAMLFWNIGVQKVGGTQSGMFLNFNPIFTAFFAYLFLDERMNLIQFFGTCLVISGILLFTTERKLRWRMATTDHKSA